MQVVNVRDDHSPEADPVGDRASEVDAWARIPPVTLDHRHLARNRIISYGRHDPAHVAFDLLRTRLTQALKARGWTRVAITSPSKACGKTFVAGNLALSLARQPSCRTLLLDLDLRIPSLARVLGIRTTAQPVDFLTGRCPPEALLRRVAPNLLIGPGRQPFPDSAELLQEPSAVRALNGLRTLFAPDVILYDLPPALACDDVIAFLPQVDCVLLVAGGGISSAKEIRECERLIDGQSPLLGCILNKADDVVIEPYYS